MVLNDVTVIEFAHDLAGTTAFYRDVLGLPVKTDDPEFSEFVLARERDDMVLRIERTDDLEHRGKLRWFVDDLDEWLDKLRGADTEHTVEGEAGSRIVTFSDPHGNQIQLHEQN